MHRNSLTALVAAASIVSLAACSSSGGKKAPSASPTKSTSKSATAFPSSSSPAPSASETVTATEISRTLLTPTDLQLTGATSAPDTSADHPLPCLPATGKSLSQEVPATVKAGVDITDDALQAALAEEVRLYTDAATAGAALAAAKAGLNCTTGSLRSDDGAVTAQIQAPIDIASDLAKDSNLSGVPIAAALVWQATAAGDNIDLAVVQLDRSLVLFTFQSASGADTTKLPNPEDVIAAGLEKIVNS